MRRRSWGVGLGVLVCTLVGGAAVSQQIASGSARFEETTDRYFRDHATRRIYLQLDKPLYQAGETLHVRAFELQTASLGLSDSATYEFQLRDPKGAVIANRSGEADSADFALDANAPGGQYALTVRSASGTSETRTVQVSQYETPRFKKSLKLLRQSYGPGDEVRASVELRMANDAPFAKREVEAVLSVDGTDQRAKLTTDERGKTEAHFTLPFSIDRGEVQLSIVVRDAGITEQVNARVPVVLRKLQLSFFPEGGDLVQGLPGRIYFAAKNPLGKPVDIEGRIVDDRGDAVVSFTSVHDGMGRFVFRPTKGRVYRVEVTRPSGIIQSFPLPTVQSSGCVLSTPDDFSGEGSVLRVRIGCSQSRPVLLSAFLRENRLASTQVQLDAWKIKDVSLKVPHLVGVARVTLFSDRFEPLAERLVFRRLQQQLKVTLQPDRTQYSPRDPVSIDVRTTDADGRPVSADLAIAVVDDTVLSLANDKTGHLRAHLLLEKELVDAVEDPDFYFSSNAKAAAALDALLGTRGWRRFAWQQVFYVPPPMPPHRPYKKYPSQPSGGGMPGMAARAPSAAPSMDDMAPELSARRAEAKAEQEVAFEEGDRVKVREHAPQMPIASDEPPRSDFRQSVFWSPSIRTQANGRATVKFNLSDAVTSFRAVAEGVSRNGLLGGGDAVISSTLPFYVEVKLPLEVSEGDRIDLPVTLRNGQSTPLDIRLQGQFGSGLRLLNDPSSREISLAANAGQTVTYPLSVQGSGKADIALNANGGGFRDGIRRTLEIAPLGFPRSDSLSGTVAGIEAKTINLQKARPGSIRAKLILYPSPIATMVSGLESMVREPVGCFEQASSANYPNVMVMDYLRAHGDKTDADQGLRARTELMLDRGYRKVTSYETPAKGYEWFGAAPGHQALTAYGLLEFADMRKVFGGVDANMVARTAEWLLSQRDGKGGFVRNTRALDSFGRASDAVTNGYIVYALCETGYCNQVRAEFEAVRRDAMQTDDAYRVALATKAQLNFNAKAPESTALLQRLISLQRPEGSFHGTTDSITRSGGKSLDVETTALATMALVAADRLGEARNAVRWMIAQREGGGFGSTQATVLALKALTVYDQQAAKTPESGELVVKINGSEVGRARFDAGRREPIVFEGFNSALVEGQNKIAITLSSGAAMPYSFTADYTSDDPPSSPDAAVRVSTRLSSNAVAMGGTVRLDAVVENVTSQGQPMTLARIGLPGGSTFQLWQLKELVETHQIDFFETRAREVIVYFRALPPKAKKQIGIDLVGAIPGQYKGPASSAYLYYTAEKKAWASPLSLNITP